jgi:hypothetical protein
MRFDPIVFTMDVMDTDHDPNDHTILANHILMATNRNHLKNKA